MTDVFAMFVVIAAALLLVVWTVDRHEVKPMFPWISEMRAADPEWWDRYSDKPFPVGMKEFAKRNPSHPFSERIRRELA